MNLEIGYDLDTLLGSVALDYKLTLGDNATGDTPMYWGDVVSGNAYYYFVDANAVNTLQTCKFYFNSNIPQNYSVVQSGNISVMGVRCDSVSGSSPISLSVASNNISISGGSVWQYGLSLNPPYTGKSNSARIIVYNNDTGVGASTPTYRVLADETSTLPTYFASTSWDGITYTTSSTLHSKKSTVPYIPISGQTMSYNDLRQYIVNEYNAQNPSETINVDDLPAFDDSTEPTNDIQPFSLDYDEILGEREMESIIAETRYILDTTPYEIESFDYMLEASAPYEILKDAGTLSDGLIASVGKVYSITDDVVPPEIISLYAFLAFLGVGMWFLLRR